MKRTKWVVQVGETVYRYPIYRRVMTDGQRYYIRWNGYIRGGSKLIDVTDKQVEFIEDYGKRTSRQTW